MKEYETGAVRDTGGKGRMDLLPMCALIRVSKHMEDAIAPDPKTGTPHYPERNWEKGIPIHSMIDSALRHLAKYVDGWTDEDHLCAAATNLLMAMWTEEKIPVMQDIPSRASPKPPDGSSSALDNGGGTPVSPDHGTQEKGYGELSKVCDAYDKINRVCWGTKEKESCQCNGYKWKCDFYPEFRTVKHHD